MFGIEREHLVKGLVRISCRLCGYLGHRCDCKYMGDSEDFYAGSEQTGCPETAMAASIINSMTNEEFYKIAKRAGVHINLPDDEPLDIAAITRHMKTQRNDHFIGQTVQTTIQHKKSKK